MTFGQIPTGEKEPARWEPAGSELRNWEAIRTIHRIEQPDHPYAQDSLETLRDYYGKEGRGGMVLRQGNRPIGYFLYRVENRETPQLYIEKVHVLKEDRSPVIMSKFIQVLREQAERLNIPIVAWDRVSPDMREVSDAVGTSTHQGYGRYTIPVEKLNSATIVDMFIEHKKKSADSPRNYV